MEKRIGSKVIFIIECVEYLILLAVFYQCNSLYTSRSELFNYTDMNLFFYRFVILNLLVVLFLHLIIAPWLMERVRTYMAVLLIYVCGALLFYFANVCPKNPWSRPEYIRNFFILLPLFYLLFRIHADQGKIFEILFKHSNIVTVYSALNLIVYFASVFNLSSLQSEDVYSRWASPGTIGTYKVFLNIVGIYSGIAWQLFDLPLLRNYGIFTEPLMYTVPLVTALGTEMFLRPKNNKMRVYKWILLSVTLITAQSTLGLIILAVLWGMKLIETSVSRGKTLLIIPAIVVSALFAGLFVYEKQLRYYDGAVVSSTTIHIEHIMAGFRAFLNKPLFGGGYGDTSFVQGFINAEKFDPTAGLSNSGAVILGEGGILLGLICMSPFFACLFNFFKKGRRKLALWCVGPLLCYMLIIWHFSIFMILLFAFGYSIMGQRNNENNMFLEKLQVNANKKAWIVPLVYILSGVVLICAGGPVWKAINYLLQTNQWSIALSAIKAFYLSSAFLINLIVVSEFVKNRCTKKELISVVLADLVYLVLYKRIYSFINTLFSVKRPWSERGESFALFLIWLILWGVIFYCVKFVFKNRNKQDAVKCIGAVCASMFVLLLIPGAIFRQDIAMIQSDIESIKPVLEYKTGKAYINDLPMLYCLADSRISYTGTKDVGFDRCENCSVILKKGSNLRPLFASGYRVAEISDGLLVYSNDEGVISGLEETGYEWHRYYPYEQYADLNYLAECNGLTINEAGNLVIEGSEKSLIHGPYLTLGNGKYEAYYKLHVDRALLDSLDDNSTLGTLQISTFLGEKKLVSKEVKRSRFDENGDAIIDVSFYLSGYQYIDGVEYLLFANDDYQIEVSSISIRETPDYVTITTEDGYGNIIKEEFFGTDGEPYTVSGGYEKAERELDLRGRVNLIKYFDGDGNRKTVGGGYSARGFKYNRQGSVISEKYYDDNDDLVNLSDGYAEVVYEYDDKGNRSVIRYYDAEGNPVMIKSGYSVVRRFYDDNRRIIREEYYDENEAPIALSTGQAAIEYEYDENGNSTVTRYFDSDNAPVLYNGSYYSLVVEYNENKQNIHEEYHGTDDKPISVSDGSYGHDRRYDNVGNVIECVYLGQDMEPIINTSGYAIWRREYNDLKQIIREVYYGTDDTPILLSDGACGYRREYDDAGNVTVTEYLGTDGNPTLNTSGYAILKRSYDIKKQITREEYCDETGNPTALSRGQAAVEYEYDGAGNRTVYRYYDASNLPILYNGQYHRLEITYNELKQNILEKYYGTDGNTIQLSDGAAGYIRGYDENGNTNLLTYLGLDFEPTINNAGYATWRRTYNDKKQVVREEYYDTHDHKTLRPQGQFAVEYGYDDAGNCIMDMYYGLDNERILFNGKYWKSTRIYNENKKVIHEEYYDLEDKPALISESYHSIDYTYDDNNNLVKRTYKDLEGKVVDEQIIE